MYQEKGAKNQDSKVYCAQGQKTVTENITGNQTSPKEKFWDAANSSGPKSKTNIYKL